MKKNNFSNKDRRKAGEDMLETAGALHETQACLEVP